jgi:hypothetical protein
MDFCMTTLAQAVAGSIAVPLNVATKEDLRTLVTREHFDAAVKELREAMAAKGLEAVCDQRRSEGAEEVGRREVRH